jgi:hypothetical protein
MMCGDSSRNPPAREPVHIEEDIGLVPFARSFNSPTGPDAILDVIQRPKGALSAEQDRAANSSSQPEGEDIMGIAGREHSQRVFG